MAVQVEADEQALHVVSAAAAIALQLKNDSQPLAGLESLLNLPLMHAEIVLHSHNFPPVSSSGCCSPFVLPPGVAGCCGPQLWQAVHVVSAAAEIVLQLYEDSQPLAGSESLSNLPLVHAEIVVQSVADEQVVQVVSSTDIALQSREDSQPF